MSENYGQPVNEYHLEIIATPRNSHGDFASYSPFPSFNVGDVVRASSFATGGTMGIPDDRELVVTRIAHHLQFFDPHPPHYPKGANHITTVLYCEERERS